MRNLPVNLSGHTLMITEPPAVKMRQGDGGAQVEVTNYLGELQYSCNAFIKAIPEPGQRAAKGEEITITLSVDPGDGFDEGSYVELINPVINAYAIPDEKNPRLIKSAGLSFKADGLKPAARKVMTSAA